MGHARVDRRRRLLVTVAAAGLAFEAAALLDPFGAAANDLDLLVVGAGASGVTTIPPPNVMMLFDDSSTMNNLLCTNQSGAARCSADTLVAKVASGGATICESPALRAVNGVTAAGAAGPYQPAFDANGTSLGFKYDTVFDGAFASGGVFSQAVNAAFSSAASSIADLCDGFSDCSKKQRCLYSLRTLGYFWEPATSTCGSGDPSATCSTLCGNHQCDTGETPCNCAADCTQSTCGDGCCHAASGETSTTCSQDCGAPPPPTCTDACGDFVCCSAASGGTETLADCPKDCSTEGTLGHACDGTHPCNSGYYCTGSAGNTVCSLCDLSNDGCASSKTCVNTGCSYYHCDSGKNSSCSAPVGGGGGGGGALGGGGMLGLALDVATRSAVSSPAAGLASDLAQAATGTRSGGGSDDGPFFLGDFLNFYPPKAIALKAAFYYTVNHLTGDARIGVTKLSDNNYPGHKLWPTCNKMDSAACFDGDPATQCYGMPGSQYENYVRNLTFGESTKPLAKALDEMGAYYADDSGNAPICNYTTTKCSTSNFIVLVTDGTPIGDETDWSRLSYVSQWQSSMTPNSPDNGSWLDEVAYALTKIDARPTLNNGDKHTISTYTVSYGDANPDNPSACIGLLDATATWGDGRCLLAQNATGLRSALSTIMTEIINRVRGFTAPSLPTTRSAGASTLTSAVFRPSESFPLWEGHIYGFRVCDTKLARDTGTTCTCPTASTTDQICIEDADSRAILYDDDGYLTSRPYWDAQLCLSGNFAGTPYSPPLPPDQHNLDISGCKRTADQRVILTAVAGRAGTATKVENADVFGFTAANVTAESTFLDALAVAGDTAEGAKVVDFFRGKDTYDKNANSNRTEDRNENTFYNAGTKSLTAGWWKLGEVFHSIPVTVGPPTGDHLTAAQRASASWTAFQAAHVHRQKQLLVGANDGMLHSFVVGTWSSSYGTSGGYDPADSGNGKEAWAFVSPEMLGKLKSVAEAGSLQVGSHTFLVDGSVEVRDVWIGGNAAQNVAESSRYWRTVAVYGHRDGGRTYIALDITDADDSHPPTLLWQFPQPSTTEYGEMARSWLDVAPAPASIGALVEQTTGGAFVEHWVALLSGGFDPLDHTGRMLVAVDIGTGDVLWELKHGDAGADGMDYSFPATPVFYSRATEAKLSIDGIIAADHGGQLWHIPTPPAALNDGKFTYTAQRFFRAGDERIDPPPSGATAVDADHYQRWPFFFAPTLTFNGSKVRVIIGTGDRDQLIPSATAATGIGGQGGYVCKAQQRLYAIDVGTCAGQTDDICTEQNLVHVSGSDNSWTYAPPESRGWYYLLADGEKAATPFNIFHGYAMYSTFLPTLGCGASADVCSPDAKGEARLYARYYLTGKPLDWNGDNSLVNETFVSLGQGVPTAPSVSVGVSAAGSTPAIFAGGSDTGLTTQSSGGLGGDTSQEVLRLYVSSELHDTLH